MTFVINPYAFTNASAALDKAAVSQAFPASTFSTTSGSYTNLLNGSGGAAIQITGFQKGSGTRVMIAGGGQFTASSNITVTIGVNDGTSDSDIAPGNFNASTYGSVEGEIALTGLAAGTYTFTLRIKTGGGVQVNFDSNCSAFLRAWEVAA